MTGGHPTPVRGGLHKRNWARRLTQPATCSAGTVYPQLDAAASKRLISAERGLFEGGCSICDRDDSASEASLLIPSTAS